MKGLMVHLTVIKKKKNFYAKYKEMASPQVSCLWEGSYHSITQSSFPNWKSWALLCPWTDDKVVSIG